MAICLWMCMVSSLLAGNVHRTITDLRVNYETCPFGVDSPVFSWRMEAVGEYKASQKAYRIVMADSEAAMRSNRFVYDTGKTTGSESVCLRYKGNDLKPCTRYYWKVYVWDERDRMWESPVSWYETSLMDSGWDGAQWIGSDKEILSKYASNLIFDYDVQISPTSHEVSFVFGVKDENNYWGARYCVYPNTGASLSQKQNRKNKGEKVAFRPQFVLFHCLDGTRTDDKCIDLSEIIGEKDIYNVHHVQIANWSEEYNRYEIRLKVDGKEVEDSLKKKVFKLQNDKWKGMCRLLAVGYEQPVGNSSRIGNLTIRDHEHKTLFYSDSVFHTLNGSGALVFGNPNGDIAAPMLRKSFSVKGKVRKATAFFTAKGIYELSLNGKRANEDFYNPGWTDYRHRFMYNTYDVTRLLQQGDNVIGAELGEGWWRSIRFSNPKWYHIYGTSLSLMGKLLIEYEDGTKEVIVTDPSWKCSNDGPVMTNGFYEGEDYDARREMTGWNTTSFDASHWRNCKTFPGLDEGIEIVPYVGQSVMVDTVCVAHSISEPISHTYIYDMGQNMVGIPHIRLKGKRGQTITVQYGEMKYPDIIPTDPVPPYTIEMYKEKKGQLYTENYRSAMSTDHYTMKGDEDGEIFEPHFTCHGFRYIQITGLESPLPLEDVRVMVLNSLQDKQNCTYETSDELLNQLFSNIQWGQKSNFVTIPTDCPQRDERAGWSGDAQIFCRTSTYNRNVNPFFHRWMYSVRDNQLPHGGYSDVNPTSSIFGSNFGWSDVGVIVPWQIYQQYGDTTILESNYEAMKKYMGHIERNAKNYIQPYGGYGDWVALTGTQSDLTNTCYAAYSVRLMAKTAGVLGKSADKEYYEALFSKIKKAFNERYVDKNGYVTAPVGSPVSVSPYGAASKEKVEEPTPIKTQTAYVVPLYMDMIEDSVAPKAAEHLVELVKENGYRLNTGFIGTPYINLVLSAYGYDDVAYRLFEQQDYPSWLYPVLQGATTMWERWNSYTIKNGFGPVSMNSFNHYAYGAVQDWMMIYSCGIQRDERHPGYKRILLQPRVRGTSSYIKGAYHSVYGKIESGWKKTDTDSKEKSSFRMAPGYIYTAVIPANTTAELVLPVSSQQVKVLKGKKGIISRKKASTETVVYELGSGEYEFQIK